MEFLFFSEENLELMEDLNVIDLIVDAIKMHKKVCWNEDGLIIGKRYTLSHLGVKVASGVS